MIRRNTTSHTIGVAPLKERRDMQRRTINGQCVIPGPLYVCFKPSAPCCIDQYTYKMIQVNKCVGKYIMSGGCHCWQYYDYDGLGCPTAPLETVSLVFDVCAKTWTLSWTFQGPNDFGLCCPNNDQWDSYTFQDSDITGSVNNPTELKGTAVAATKTCGTGITVDFTVTTTPPPLTFPTEGVGIVCKGSSCYHPCCICTDDPAASYSIDIVGCDGLCIDLSPDCYILGSPANQINLDGTYVVEQNNDTFGICGFTYSGTIGSGVCQVGIYVALTIGAAAGGQSVVSVLLQNGGGFFSTSYTIFQTVTSGFIGCAGGFGTLPCVNTTGCCLNTATATVS
jgi:hypothetical protein